MAKLDQSKTPYVDALKKYVSDDVSPFDVPGHHMIKPEESKPMEFTYRYVLFQGVADSIDALVVGVTIGTNIHITVAGIGDYRPYIAFLIIGVMVFALAGLMSESGKGLFLPIAFDSGGVTTGPVTVPFILAFGAGLAASKSGNGRSGEDAFGLTALASVGPIITVMIMSVSGLRSVSCLGKKITTNYGYFTVKDGPAAFLTDSTTVTDTENFDPATYLDTKQLTYLSDFDKMVFYPRSGWGQAFNTDPNGAYFLMSYSGPITRVYMIGDTIENGVTKTNQLLCYDYKMLRNYNWAGGNGDKSGNGLFGFYPHDFKRALISL